MHAGRDVDLGTAAHLCVADVASFRLVAHMTAIFDQVRAELPQLAALLDALVAIADAGDRTSWQVRHNGRPLGALARDHLEYDVVLLRVPCLHVLVVTAWHRLLF